MAVRKQKKVDAAAEAPGELLLMGRFFKPHGVRGEIKVIPETDDPARFEALETVYAGDDARSASPLAVESVRIQQTKHGMTVLLKLEGINSVEAAEGLRQRLVFAREDELPALAEDEFYLHDLIGLRVESEEGEEIGKVKDVIDLPGQYVCVVARRGKPDAMIPGVPEFIVGMDLEAGRLVVRPIEGLLE